MIRLCLLGIGSILLMAACAAVSPDPAPEPVDLTDLAVLLVGFSPNARVRAEFEDRLQAALTKEAVRSVRSHPRLAAFSDIDHHGVLATAAAENTELILMVRRVASEVGQHAPRAAASARRYPTLRHFLASADDRSPEPPPPGRQVVEVYGYIRDGDGARLIWNGFSWIDFDGDLSRAIGETAELIATNMARSRDAVRASMEGEG